jgi:hypothetical protein
VSHSAQQEDHLPAVRSFAIYSLSDLSRNRSPLELKFRITIGFEKETLCLLHIGAEPDGKLVPLLAGGLMA